MTAKSGQPRTTALGRKGFCEALRSARLRERLACLLLTARAPYSCRVGPRLSTPSSTAVLFSLPALVTANPEDDITAGEQLIIESKRFPIESTRSGGQVENWGVFEGAVLAIAFPDERWNANVLG